MSSNREPNSYNGVERRKKSRAPVYYWNVVDRNTSKLIGLATDVTLDGMMLVLQDPIELGIVLQCRIIIPEEAEIERTLNVDIKSLWCSPDRNRAFFAAGFQFVNVDEETAQIISTLVDV
jgi:hypothetical protein